MSVQGFRIEPGAAGPEYSHRYEQSGTIHAGTLTFAVDGERLDVGSGDAPHGPVNEGDVPVEGVDVFSLLRPNPDWS